MERLTDKFKCKNNTGKIMNAHNVSKQQIIDQLSAYEDTGLTPDQATQMQQENAELKELLQLALKDLKDITGLTADADTCYFCACDRCGCYEADEDDEFDCPRCKNFEWKHAERARKMKVEV